MESLPFLVRGKPKTKSIDKSVQGYSGEYGVSSSFNVADLTPFFADGDFEDLRANTFQEGGNDENPKAAQIHGPMTRG